jgi:hypothetical protein
MLQACFRASNVLTRQWACRDADYKYRESGFDTRALRIFLSELDLERLPNNLVIGVVT